MATTEQFLPPPQDITLTPLLEKLQNQIALLETEFEQSKQIWRTALANERAEFLSQLKEKESVWAERESAWVLEKQRYEQGFKNLEGRFQKQLQEVQENALQALNSLESAWQKEKQTWQRAAAPSVLEKPLPSLVSSMPSAVAAATVNRSAVPAPAANPELNQTLSVLNEQVLLLRQILQGMSNRR